MRPEVEQLFSLSGDDFRAAVLGNAGPLTHEIHHLEGDQRERVAEVVRAAWPDAGIAASVEREEHTVRFRDLGAHAWLTLAPALDLAPTPEQWASLAASGVVLTDTANWLHGHYSEEAAVIAAATCEAKDARSWADLVSAIPYELAVPDVIADALVEHLSEPSGAEVDFELPQIGDRFVRSDRLDVLQKLSAKNAEFERGLRPYRARLGEREGAQRLLEELIESLREGKRVDREDAEWLEGVGDTGWLGEVDEPALLGELFESLQVAVEREESSPFGVANAIMRAIYRIGGDDAVRMYDELIASSEDSRVKFLRIQRDEIVQAELRKTGQAGARDLAVRLNVPVLDADSDDRG